MPSHMIFYFDNARLTRAIGAAVEGVVGLDAVPDDLTFAVVTHGREFVDRALEAVERVARAGRDDFKRQVIIVTADFTLCHRTSPLSSLRDDAVHQLRQHGEAEA